MIKNKKILEKFEVEFLKSQKTNYKENFQIFDELYKIAKCFNKFQFDPLEDLEYDIKYVFAVNKIKRKWKQKIF